MKKEYIVGLIIVLVLIVAVVLMQKKNVATLPTTQPRASATVSEDIDEDVREIEAVMEEANTSDADINLNF